MTLNPEILQMIADAQARHPVDHPDTFIPNELFHALVDRLNAIDEPPGEARDRAIHFALVETGKIAPESWREFYL